jgi:hypothetical protein
MLSAGSQTLERRSVGSLHGSHLQTDIEPADLYDPHIVVAGTTIGRQGIRATFRNQHAGALAAANAWALSRPLLWYCTAHHILDLVTRIRYVGTDVVMKHACWA